MLRLGGSGYDPRCYTAEKFSFEAERAESGSEAERACKRGAARQTRAGCTLPPLRPPLQPPPPPPVAHRYTAASNFREGSNVHLVEWQARDRRDH